MANLVGNPGIQGDSRGPEFPGMIKLLICQGQVAGSIPSLATNKIMVLPGTSVTIYSGHIGNSLAPKGFSALVTRPVS